MEPFKLKKITVDDLYISVLTTQRVTTAEGMIYMKPVDKTAPATGSLLMDAVAVAVNRNCGISQKELAEWLGMDSPTFGIVFKVATGRIPQDFFRDFRLKKACEWLACTDVSLREVTRRSGFKSQSSMTRTFREQLRITPERYRKRHRPANYRELYTWEK